MRKGKLMLSVLIIVAVLAASLAFKTTRSSNHFLYTGPLNSGVCTTRVNGAVIILGTPNCAASTVSLASGCPNACTVTEDD